MGAMDASARPRRRVRVDEERCSDRLQVPMPPTLRADVGIEAELADYTSAAAFARDALAALIQERKMTRDATMSGSHAPHSGAA